MPLRFRRPFRRLVSPRSPLRTGCLLTVLVLAIGWLTLSYTGVIPPVARILARQGPPAATQPAGQEPAASQADGSDPATGAPDTPVAGSAKPNPTTIVPSTAPATAAINLPLDPTGPTPSELGRLSSATPVANSQPPIATPTDALSLLRGSQSVPVSDLLFVSGNQLLMWHRRSLQVRVLAQSPEAFVASSDGAVILTLHAHESGGGPTGPARFDLRRIDPSTGTQTVIIENIPQPQMLTITPNGERVAFWLEGDRSLVYTLNLLAETPPKTPTPTSTGTTPTPSATPTPTQTPAGPSEYAVGTASPIGSCEALPGERCGSLAWSPDGRGLAWTDGRGIWMADAITREAGQVHDLRVQVADPRGAISEYDAEFDELVWSPDGRFILMRVTPKNSKVTWRAVLDVRSRKMASAADSFAIDEAESRVAWVAADRIVVAHASDLTRRTPPFIHIWNVFSTNPQLLVSGRQYDLYSEEFPFSPHSSKSIPAHQVDWLSMQIPGKLLFGIRLPETSTEPVLFTLDLTTGIVNKIHTLPLGTDRVAYAPDGSGALAGGPEGFVFAPLNGGGLIDLSRVFNQSARQLQWLTPTMPRKP